MKLTKLPFLFSVLIGLLLTVSAFAQSETFSDANVEYTFDLPEAGWKMTFKPSPTIPNVEYVYGDRADGHLEIRKLSVKSGELLSDIIRDEEQKLQFLPGYVAGKEEDFRGSLSGKVFNYEFVRSGKAMSGRFYFLKAGDATVYILRFDGLRDKLRSIRNQTDSIARTFELKKSK
ncbi:hypothetical protein BH24ACI2_BH24ACI2_06940 [soil metagenome]|jgi:hypothetical protein|nr:hypothetical protein [Acidobacteriota bacterium]